MKAKVLIGIPEPSWLWRPHPGLLADEDVVMFPSRNRLHRRKTPYPHRALYRFCVDSASFFETQHYGRFRIPPAEYADEIRGYGDQLGWDKLLWAAPQDVMCEPWVIYGKNKHLPQNDDKYFHGTRELRGLGPDDPEQDLTTAVRIHQRLTVDNFLELTRIAPDLPFIPVLQGWTLEDYFHCKKLYEDAGVDLNAYPVVGLGSVCRRQDTEEIADIVEALAATGLRLHGFGVKTSGLGLYGDLLCSVDSQAWSKRYRLAEPGKKKLPQCKHRAKTCSYCLEGAFVWYRSVKNTPPDFRQMKFDLGAAA